MATRAIHERGRTDDKGHWKPEKPLEYAPLFVWPIKPIETLKYLFRWGGYLWPVKILYGALALGTWYLMHAGNAATYETILLTWIWPVLVRNLVLMLVVFGIYHFTVYIKRVEETYGKYHPEWQARNARKFLFNDQVKDNMFRSIVSGVPIWSAWEVLYLWLSARGRLPVISFASHPGWFIGLFLLLPLWRDVHFYCIHRLLHWKPLLRTIHSIHHKNPTAGLGQEWPCIR